MSLSRRSFLESAAMSTLAARAVAAETDPKTGMPMRALGKTGEKVSLLAFGAGSRWLMYPNVEKGMEALDLALKSGINYVDSAHSYGNGQSHRWIGQFLKTHKKNFFLVSKVGGRTGNEAMRQVEESLKDLGVSQFDLLHIHNLGTPEDLAAIEAKGGVLETMYKLRDQKVARFIGITCHTNPTVLKTALERHNFDSTQMALNVARMGNASPSDKPGQGMTGLSGFEAIALPVAVRKGMGATAMKVFAQEKLLGKVPVETLLRYAMTLPVAAAVCGMPQVEHIETNLKVAKAFRPLGRSEMESLSDSVANKWKASIDQFFMNHEDC